MNDERPPDPSSSGPAQGPGEEQAEPEATGTLFIMLLFLMALGAMWGLMYLILLNR